jgi:ABC-type enterobactin transport system permease subunit
LRALFGGIVAAIVVVIISVVDSLNGLFRVIFKHN